ncbi:hypothetical protein [Klebsiella michiganensis]|uniref:hypothetical protein n=1 Tax=Klebsiella michiganensis TaxID=1134687 RepID=UPI002447E91F|nr:hypothetical protein [Klebsiella michiganensis]MDH1763731.1 hypothetical protein [Klebsiella michiganensis]
MAIIAVASTWYPKDRKINFYIFLLSIVTFLGLVVLGFLCWFIEGSVYGLLSAAYVLIFLCMTRLRLIVYRYNVKSSVKRIVASVKEGKRVAFIAHQNLDLRYVVVSMFSSMLPDQSRVIHGPFGFGMDTEIEFIKKRNSADEGYLVIFLNQLDSYSWLKFIAGDSPEKAIAYNFDFIPDLESENETK